jgi:hypothetical protein
MRPENDRRQSQRILFERKNDVMGHFSILEKPDRSIVVHILNMSTGGIFFTLRSNRDVQLKVGEKIIFEDIRNKDSKVFILRMEAEIIWIMDNASMEYVGVGSKFVDLDSEKEDRIKNCMKYCQTTAGHN